MSFKISAFSLYRSCTTMRPVPQCSARNLAICKPCCSCLSCFEPLPRTGRSLRPISGNRMRCASLHKVVLLQTHQGDVWQNPSRLRCMLLQSLHGPEKHMQPEEVPSRYRPLIEAGKAYPIVNKDGHPSLLLFANANALPCVILPRSYALDRLATTPGDYIIWTDTYGETVNYRRATRRRHTPPLHA